MNTEVYDSIREPLSAVTAATNVPNLELAIIELKSGNYDKALVFAEELIKKDLNDTAGWAIKALSQGHMFDYGSKTSYLKSSLNSMKEFQSRSKVKDSDKQTIEALFLMNLIDRTTQMIRGQLSQAVRKARNAEVAMSNAQAAELGAALSVAGAVMSKSTVGTVVGVAGAAVGVGVSVGYESKAYNLMEAANGQYASAIANMNVAIGLAQTLKRIVDKNECSREVCIEGDSIIQNWLGCALELFVKIATNFQGELKAKKTQLGGANQDWEFSSRVKVLKGLGNGYHGRQLLYLAEMYGLTNSNELRPMLTALNNLEKMNWTSFESELKSKVITAFIVMGSGLLPYFILMVGFDQIGIGILLALLFVVIGFVMVLNTRKICSQLIDNLIEKLQFSKSSVLRRMAIDNMRSTN